MCQCASMYISKCKVQFAVHPTAEEERISGCAPPPGAPCCTLATRRPSFTHSIGWPLAFQRCPGVLERMLLAQTHVALWALLVRRHAG